MSLRNNRSINSDNVAKTKRERKVVTLEQKLEILRRYDAGYRPVDIARRLRLPSSTVRTIIQNGDRIKQYSKVAATPMVSKCVFKKMRNPVLVDMENMLLNWISSQIHNGEPLTPNIIQEMARTIYEDLKKNYGEAAHLVEPFKASGGWFERFKRRANLTYLKAEGTVRSVHRTENVVVNAHPAETTEPKPVLEGMRCLSSDVVDAVELIGEALYILHECDPDRERSASVCKAVSAALDAYREFFKPQPSHPPETTP